MRALKINKLLIMLNQASFGAVWNNFFDSTG
jgi:hypothetical protein